MDEIEKKAWRMVLPLWKNLGTNNYSSTFIRSINNHGLIHPSRLKNHVLMKLGYDKCDAGCPFCEYFFCKKDCPLNGCEELLNGCYKYNYNYWEKIMFARAEHNKKYALKFYHEMVLKFIERCNRRI